MTEPSDSLRDIYHTAARLLEELGRLPEPCACPDATGCRCGRPRGFGAARPSAQCAGLEPHLVRLRERVRAFESDVRREGRHTFAGEVGWDVARVEATVGGVGRLAEEIGRAIGEEGAACAAEAIERLRGKAELLEERLRELGDSMSDPAGATAKWMPLRLAKGGAADGVPPAARAHDYGDDGPATPERLREIVRRHEVCYEVWPEWAAAGGSKIRIGYRLELCGVNEHDLASGGGHPTPGCARCRRTYDDLRRIAEWVMPKEGERASRYEVEGFDRAWHVAPRHRRSRNEIVLAVKVLHRRGVNEPADECELRCIREMRAGLAELGVAEGAYREVRSGTPAAR